MFVTQGLHILGATTNKDAIKQTCSQVQMLGLGHTVAIRGKQSIHFEIKPDLFEKVIDDEGLQTLLLSHGVTSLNDLQISLSSNNTLVDTSSNFEI